MNMIFAGSNEIRPLQDLPEGVLLLPTLGETLCISLDSIIRIEASSNYSKVFCKHQSFPIVVAKVLRWFEERLPKQLFTRVHRTHLVNRTYVISFNNSSVVLEPGIKINISRRKKKECLHTFESASFGDLNFKRIFKDQPGS